MGRKTTVWIFQAINKQNLIREDLNMAKRGNLKKEIRQCGKSDEIIKHIISGCSKLVQV